MLESIIFPVILLIIGFIFMHQNGFVTAIKDMYYYANPIIIFTFGFLSAYVISTVQYVKYVILLGTLSALIYLLGYDFHASYESVAQMKSEEGVASYLVVLSLAFISINKKIGVFIMPKIVILLAVVILLLAVIFSQSRTFLLSLFLLYIFGCGYVRFKLIRNFFIMSIITTTVVIGISYISISSSGDRSTFSGKIATSFTEILPKKYTEKADINSHWRGYEAYRGLLAYQESALINKIIGSGYGKTATLGFYMKLKDRYYDEIYKFHNGYVNILLKTGILGLIIYIFYFISLIYYQSISDVTDNLKLEFSKNMISALAATILILTIFIAGWLNKQSMIPIIFSLGFFIHKNHMHHKASMQ